MSKTLQKEMVAYVLAKLCEAEDYVNKGSDLNLKFALNRIRAVRDVIIEHAVEDVPIETTAEVSGQPLRLLVPETGESA